MSICTDGTIDVSGSFHAGVEVKSIKNNIGAILHGTIEFDIPNRVIEWTDMFINIHGEVTIPVFIIPLVICDIGIEVCVDITPHVGITFNLEPTANPSEGIVPGLGIKIKDDNGIIGDVGCMVQAYAEEDFGGFDLYVEASGDGTLYLQTPPDPTYFDDFILSCWIGAQLRIGFWTYEGWWTYEWIWSDQQRSSKEYTENDWQTLNTSYLYPDQGSYSNLPWSETFYNGTLIENVFPYAHPCIAYNTASREDKVMMVMAHHNDQNPGDPVQDMEILWGEWNENTGLADIWVIGETRNDNRLQMDPKIAFDKNGNVVCVFIQTDSSITSNSDVMDAFNATEIAYCVYDKNSGAWSDINLITDNNKMDVSPVLASSTNGDILLVWTSDADNDHKTTDDRSIYASFWDGNGWSDTECIVENYSFRSGPAIAIHDDSEAICVFSRMVGNDEWVFYSRFQNGIWGSVKQFTYDAWFNETQPSAVYDIDGTAYIIWLKNKFDEDGNGNLIYDGNLYYKPVGSGSTVLITNGTIYDPVAIPSQSSGRTDVDFLVGWKSGYAANELRYAEIKTGERTNNSNGNLIFSSDKKLSEVSWCFMQDSIAVGTTERETLRNGGENCNLTFIYWSNYPPNKPIISGPTKGKPGTEYDYIFRATDPDGDDVKYFIDWGDGNTEWTGFSASGTPVTVSHTWAEKDTYTITAKAQDEYGLEGPEGTLEVTMPKNKAFDFNFPLLSWLFERFPNAFPILRQLLGL
ncbi:PKD domain protein [Thermoplasmatales archaeon SCGC AB-540-F20]|nr:PKD domain protein [Thermoplasmatales archaeon SCGC AB-540-F20]